jgi:hypothetical protein
MKKRRKTELRPKPRPKAKKKTASPWHKYKTVLPKTAAQPIDILSPNFAAELVLGGNPAALAEEIEQRESDPDAEPDELTEDEE